jgi:hypothetical protein
MKNNKWIKIKFTFLISLGSYPDGSSNLNQIAGLCNPSDNYIMSSNINLYNIGDTNLQNLFKFSSCSIEQLKLFLLNSDKT